MKLTVPYASNVTFPPTTVPPSALISIEGPQEDPFADEKAVQSLSSFAVIQKKSPFLLGDMLLERKLSCNQKLVNGGFQRWYVLGNVFRILPSSNISF